MLDENKSMDYDHLRLCSRQSHQIKLISACYKLGNVTMMVDKIELLRQYPRYCHKMVSLYSVHQAPSYKPKSILLASFAPTLAYLSMLCILERPCTAGSIQTSPRINNMLK